ncbi:TPA: L-arabinose ABC transporter permease AraH [Aeromonas salmonicida]|nr:L-arabinose ABC transporter permease AraH [Aeromonas salmonicida]ELI6442995.1 L-arabinose ABC transporter permease AraH [Aeromonas salmonicida subsp. salmonicida]EKP0242474.1 L-arabinose ABC transporter permease AraH [Aeromonas salmonicida]EKP0251211.1 L-arabinose ABC transporter permease AraH [Aeromonas salmonicida]EKP0255191.1 L-arabinose ABC transporter permease AraH [Aeromonas salmonicida]
MQLARVWDQYGMLVIFAILFLLACVLIPNFASLINMRGLGLAVSMSGMVACGMLFCLASGEFDMSVGVLFGLINGIVVAKFKINALITTLATMQMARGVGYIISDGKAVGIVEEGFFELGSSALLGIPTPIWLTALCFVLFGLLLNKTTFGRNTLAMGGNEEAARLAGVNVVRTKIIIFTMTGLIASIAGIILASRMTSGQPMTSIGFELVVISACVLGGVSMKGGIGKISYIIAGVLILGLMENAMNLLNISPFAQYVVRGLILLAAVLFDRYKQVRKARV